MDDDDNALDDSALCSQKMREGLGDRGDDDCFYYFQK